MTAGKCEISRCGLCRFYSHEGRRGGVCDQLNVNVNAHWKACSLAVSPFASTAEQPVGIAQEISHFVAEFAVAELSVSELSELVVSKLSKEEPVLPLLTTSTPTPLSVAASKSTI